MQVLLSSVTNMWRGGKGILGECVATDEGLIFNKRGFFATYTRGGLVKGISELVSSKDFYLVLPYEQIVAAVKGRFRLNRKALIVTTTEGEEIIFAISDKHKKWLHFSYTSKILLAFRQRGSVALFGQRLANIAIRL